MVIDTISELAKKAWIFFMGWLEYLYSSGM